MPDTPVEPTGDIGHSAEGRVWLKAEWQLSGNRTSKADITEGQVVWLLSTKIGRSGKRRTAASIVGRNTPKPGGRAAIMNHSKAVMDVKRRLAASSIAKKVHAINRLVCIVSRGSPNTIGWA